MNCIQITDYDIVNGYNSQFISTELTTDEIATQINKLQKFLVCGGYINSRTIVDINTALNFLTTFCHCKIMDNDTAMEFAREEGQLIDIDDTISVYCSVDVAKAALELYEE